ncbi:monocarboxylate transporter 12 isoform X1 [Rhipicephalus microplus]|uniref:monocarboxylate transporter 12 isoform X1 n=1 Tax=Rhipicephalus microplus TaxID=6941 RepID=UPI003F6C41EA
MRSSADIQQPIVDLDRCWGVPVAAACIVFLSCIASANYGFLYVLFMQRHGLSREQVAWPQTLLLISGGCVGLLVSVVQKKFSIYHITLAGGILTSAGLVGASFAPSIVWFSVAYGVVQGAGLGITFLGVAMYLLLYFDKCKATAAAIKDVGMVVAGVAGVPWISILMKEYGLQGSLLLMAGLMLHILPLVMLIKTPRRCHMFRKNDKPTGRINSQKGDVDKPAAIKSAVPLLNEKEHCVQREELPTLSNGAPRGFPIGIRFPFFVLVLLQVFSEYGNSLFMTTIVDYATDKGAELGRAKTAIMFAAIGKAVGRVLVPVVSDKTSFSRSSITMACLYVTALCFYIITRISAFEAVAALATVAGVTQGYTICMRPLLVADHLGVERLSLCSGVAGLAGMPMCLSGPAILGYFRDKHGSYDTLYYMLSGLNLVVAVLLTVLVACPVTKQRHCFTKQASLKTSFNEERV